MRPFRIVLGDLSYFNRFTRLELYVPLNIGFIAAFAKTKFAGDVECALFKDPEDFLADTSDRRPDVVALSFYYWNTELNRLVSRRIRAMYGDAVTIVWGGPSVDSDAAELRKLFDRFPDVDAFVPNEGELGLANVVERLLSADRGALRDPVDGAATLSDGALIQGLPVGLTLDLANLGSPYLMGFLDKFLDGELLPLIQTSRLCPYTCSFCVSGKNRGKLRAFPMEQVKEELDFIARRYADRAEFTMYISDENFGILKRDVDIADYIRQCSNRAGYPQKVFFYNDKRFTQTSRDVVERLGHVSTLGMTLSLQSENPETLEAIKRRNLTPEEIDSAIEWSKGRNLQVSTELIFGLPRETRRSFIDVLNRCGDRGFDAIFCYNLFIMDGIEMNRDAYRRKHDLETRFRPLGANYGDVAGKFSAEVEEVVISNDTFSFDDYLAIRGLNMMFFSIFSLSFQKWFFQFVRQLGVPLADFCADFIRPAARGKDRPDDYVRFLDDFEKDAVGELYPSAEAARGALDSQYRANGDQVAEPSLLNTRFGSRLIFRESEWMRAVLLDLLRRRVDDPEAARVGGFLLDLGERERAHPVDLRKPEPLTTEWDVLSWKRDKFKRSLDAYAISAQAVEFRPSASYLEKREAFGRRFGGQSVEEIHYLALNKVIYTRADLLYDIDIDGMSPARMRDSAPASTSDVHA